MDKRKKEIKEENFIRLMTIMDNFVQNYVEFEPESYLYPN